EPGARVPGLRAGADRAVLGRTDRCDATLVPGDRSGLGRAWIFPHERVLRPWLRHRSRSRTADGGTGNRRGAGGRSGPVPVRAVCARCGRAAGVTRLRYISNTIAAPIAP